jgi:2,3,4,5-tetrahydropyridine-2-carboxylate N-succinyltransferase
MDKTKLEQAKNAIEAAWENRATITPETLDLVLNALQTGEIRAASPLPEGGWQTHVWVKQAILLHFKTQTSRLMMGGTAPSFDKVSLQFEKYTESDFRERNTRVVPGAYVREGAFIGPQTVLMPSFVNIGAYVGEGTLVDTWATVGSCAQIGKHVHLSGGVGIGGVLEPLQASPTIIEDHCFIGARSEIVEGVIVEKGAVISMGVYIGQSTRIYDRESGNITFGKVPAGAVVVPGSLPSKCGKYNLYCAVIVKRVDEKTREKIGLNAILRDLNEDDL